MAAKAGRIKPRERTPHGALSRRSSATYPFRTACLGRNALTTAASVSR